MKRPSRRERIAAQLADLKMPGALEALDEVLAGFDGGRQTAAGAIESLLAAQIALRNSRRLEAAMRSSRLPYVRTLDTFDFSFQPSIKREQIDALHELGFLPVSLVGGHLSKIVNEGEPTPNDRERGYRVNLHRARTRGSSDCESDHLESVPHRLPAGICGSERRRGLEWWPLRRVHPASGKEAAQCP